MKYQNRGYQVTARRISKDNIEKIAEWCGGVTRGTNPITRDMPCIVFPNSDGEQTAFVGMWILELSDGEFTQMHDDEFHQCFAPAPEKSPAEMLELAWGIIANAGGGDWKTQTPDWQEAATRWRDAYFKTAEGISLPPHLVQKTPGLVAQWTEPTGEVINLQTCPACKKTTPESEMIGGLCFDCAPL